MLSGCLNCLSSLPQFRILPQNTLPSLDETRLSLSASMKTSPCAPCRSTSGFKPSIKV